MTKQASETGKFACKYLRAVSTKPHRSNFKKLIFDYDRVVETIVPLLVFFRFDGISMTNLEKRNNIDDDNKCV